MTAAADDARLRFEDLTGHVTDSSNTMGDALEAVKAGGRFLLIERSTIDGSHYLTVHDSLEDAAGYVDGQEYPEDWTEDGLFDLRSGDRFYATKATTWHRHPAEASS